MIKLRIPFRLRRESEISKARRFYGGGGMGSPRHYLFKTSTQNHYPPPSPFFQGHFKALQRTEKAFVNLILIQIEEVHYLRLKRMKY